MRMSELYDRVTGKIIAELEQGVAPWVKPWTSGCGVAECLPYNALSGRPYSGINILALWDTALEHGYEHQGWLTFRQARQRGGFVRKGEKGTHVVFTKKVLREEEQDDGTLSKREVSMLRAYVVFNVLQIENLPGGFYTTASLMPEEMRIESAEQLIGKLDTQIFHSGEGACYIPSRDRVEVPYMVLFESREHYYATLFHELGHWSGHKKRLDRDLSGRFGTRAYAAEELVAELTSAFVCASLGITGALRHAEYIGHWVELLKEDNRAIFTAASKASAAADFLRQSSKQTEAESEAAA